MAANAYSELKEMGVVDDTRCNFVITKGIGLNISFRNVSVLDSFGIR